MLLIHPIKLKIRFRFIEVLNEQINRHAVTGGRETIEEQRKYGADLTKDIPYQYLEYFLEDDEELKRIHDDYEAGRMLSGEVKKILIAEVQKIIGDFQERRAKVTDETVRQFFAIRKLEFQQDTSICLTNNNIRVSLLYLIQD